MNDLDNIKEQIKDLQKNFNPNKTTYKTLDKVINGEEDVVIMIKDLYTIKVDKYPEDIKNKYFEIIESLQKILVSKRAEEKKKEQDNKTKELKDLIASLEKRDKGDDSNSLDDDDSKSLDVEDEKVKDDIKESSLDFPEVSVDEKKKDLKDEEEDKDNDDVLEPGKKLFKVLIVLIAISIVVGVLLVVFL